MKIIMDLNHILEDEEHNDDNDIYIIMKRNHHYNDLRKQHIQINKLLFSIRYVNVVFFMYFLRHI